MLLMLPLRIAYFIIVVALSSVSLALMLTPIAMAFDFFGLGCTFGGGEVTSVAFVFGAGDWPG